MTVAMMRAARPVVARGAGKRAVSVLELIEWAFQRERVGLDFDEIERETGARSGIGMEYILMEQARLGCRVQGGGRSQAHHDADIVAAALASLPESVGGRRMAIWIAELARAGERPDHLGGARLQCVPASWRRCRHGNFAQTLPCRDAALMWPADQLGRKADGSVCPVIYVNTAYQIAAARRRYLDWYRALHHLRFQLTTACHLTSYTVTQALPEAAPWKKG